MGLQGCRRNTRSKESALGEPSPAALLAEVPKFIDRDRKCFVSAGVELTAAARATQTQQERENTAKPSWELNTPRGELLMLSSQQDSRGSKMQDEPLGVQMGSKISPKSLEDAQTSTK